MMHIKNQSIVLQYNTHAQYLLLLILLYQGVFQEGRFSHSEEGIDGAGQRCDLEAPRKLGKSMGKDHICFFKLPEDTLKQGKADLLYLNLSYFLS